MTLTDHHAHLVVGERRAAARQVKDWLKPHADQGSEIYWLEAATWGIDESRALVEKQQQKSWSGRTRFFIIAADRWTLPAQHALLKVLEEPSSETRFILLCREGRFLLPTLRSRCQSVRLPVEPVLAAAEAVDSIRLWASRFAAARPPERLPLAPEPLAPEHLSALELVYHDALLAAPARSPAEALSALRQARAYLESGASLPKLIFEHLSLTLPVL